jgi:hypothetical protein
MRFLSFIPSFAMEWALVSIFPEKIYRIGEFNKKKMNPNLNLANLL